MPQRYDIGTLNPHRAKPAADPRTTLRARCDAAIAEADATLKRCAAVLGGSTVALSVARAKDPPAGGSSSARSDRSDRPDPVETARRQMIEDSRNAWRTSPADVRVDALSPLAGEGPAPTAHGSAAAEGDAWKRFASAVATWRSSHASAAAERAAWREVDNAATAWRSSAESCRDGAPMEPDEPDEPAEERKSAPRAADDAGMYADGGRNRTSNRTSNDDSAEAARRRMMHDERNAWRTSKPAASAYDAPDDAA